VISSKTRGKNMLAGNFEPKGALWIGVKDLALALEAAKTTGVACPMGGLYNRSSSAPTTEGGITWMPPSQCASMKNWRASREMCLRRGEVIMRNAPSGFGLIIVASEILDGRIQDRHFENTRRSFIREITL